MPTLFNGNNSDSEEKLKINTDYAKNYDNWRQKEELNKLKTKYGDINDNITSDESSESESSSSSKEENELTEQFDKDFYKTLALLKNRDPKIYNQDVTFFDDTNKAQELYSEKKKEKTKKEKAVFLRDYERNIIVEREGKFSDSEDEIILKKNKAENMKTTYTQEQKQLKESFKDALEDEEEEDDLLKLKAKSENEKEKEEADYKEWLKGQGANLNDNEQVVLKPLRDFWSSPNLDANEKFLRDYVLNDKYSDKNYVGPDKDEDENEAYIIHDSDENLSEDERNIEKQEEFEHKYNFRFEEPDQEFIKRYPRTMENSLRRKDTRRSQKRAEVKQRKEEEKLRKKEELMQLKALKRKEIEEKIEKLKEITGNDDIQFNDIDLEGDFDPTEYDRKMTKIFNDDYYATPEDDIKPEFPDIDEELEIEETWDNYDPSTESYANENKYEGPHCEDPDFNMDADYDPLKKVPEDIETSKKRKRRRKSKFAELIAKEKPKFDPQQYKSYEEYFDKYYSLNYEDMIGDIPCRFKYRKVVPNDYGLSVEEILMADDKELNKWCSLKKALQYKSEHVELNDVQMYKQKAKNEILKRKVLASLYKESEEEEEGNKEEIVNPTTTTNENTESKKKRRKNKKKIEESQNDTSAETNHKAPVKDKKLDKSEKKTKNNVAVIQEESKESLKPGKRKLSEEQLEKPKKKKLKMNNLEKPKNSIENKPHEEKEAETKRINKKSSLKTEITDKNAEESKTKYSKKAKLKETVTTKKSDKGKKKNIKNKDPNSDIASLNPERLKTYGINPKKLKNKLKYGKKK
ncbi:Protein KRI1 like protein [Eufriesea mexicana]|uniref:Protein KRI1 homolog n=1 Tax=Eufriesea mexicana TaxID=516756 RepID=A0A310SBK2_9HYME|nr:PREDICTED: protein KRI1 homolog [Eufriesea mexicana]OAD52573.1 Protein KRI1 like protein [Eufriesea mexicana]